MWAKMTANGETIMPVEGLWRKPYEVLVIGKRSDGFGEGVGMGRLLGGLSRRCRMCIRGSRI